MTTKIHLLSDGSGRPLRLLLSAGQAADIKSAPALLTGQSARALIADKAYDSNALRALLADAGIQVVIPSNRTRKVLIPHDAMLYRTRNRIERCFNKLKHFRRIATRFDRRAIHFLAFLHFACALLWMRWMSIQSRASASLAQFQISGCGQAKRRAYKAGRAPRRTARF